MQRTKARVALALWVVTMLLCVGLTSWAAKGPCDCQDMIVSGAGYSSINGTYTYVQGFAMSGVQGSACDWWLGPKTSLAQGIPTGWFALGHCGNVWFFAYVLVDLPIGEPQPATPPSYTDYVVFVVSDAYYSSTGRGDCPPESGWTGGLGSPPTIQGVGACREPLVSCEEVIPTGDAGAGEFLDEMLTLAEGDVAPIIGEASLAAIHAEGDVIGGSCRILGARGAETCACSVHVYLYSVDLTVSPEERTLVSHGMADYNWDTREYEFEIRTAGLAAGYYDVLLAFSELPTQSYRIQLVAAID